MTHTGVIRNYQYCHLFLQIHLGHRLWCFRSVICETLMLRLNLPIVRVVKGIFVTRDRPFFFPMKCEMANFFLVNRDFHSSREA